MSNEIIINIAIIFFRVDICVILCCSIMSCSLWNLLQKLSDTKMEKKKRETVAFFKDMERNIFKSFEEAKKREEYLNEAGFTDMYEFDDDNYDDQMDEMLRNSVNSYRDGNFEECF